LRRLALDWVRVGEAYTVDLEVVADGAAASSAVLACSVADWLEVSDDDGVTWTAVGTDPATGVELGPLADGERKAITLRLTIPLGTDVRTKIVELWLGTGT
jgi:hypothetical protein